MALLGSLNSLVWGVPMLVLILGVGLYLTIGLKLRSLVNVPLSFAFLWRGRVAEGKGEISPFNALMTELSATIGTGNIAGVATAIFLGGPGAIFWMWMTALLGMATKYAEAVCAVRYREQDARGEFVGGPMSTSRMGWGRNGTGSRYALPCSRASPALASATWYRPIPWPMRSTPRSRSRNG